ncbi:hypothetical protein XA26_48690 [Mycolicibacterium fortuitum]|uniref:Uncharacterized protein n=1 Tax=Mycolicibacterium fortuitum TaxID=1766 RepID=A0A0N9XIQ5_MYCFO|nr:hypothetical protein XA26_48690 [Mycolicibacterium fortuitum]
MALKLHTGSCDRVIHSPDRNLRNDGTLCRSRVPASRHARSLHRQ